MHRPLLLANAPSRHERDAEGHVVWEALAGREIVPCLLGLFCVVGGVLALYFHTQYLEESARAVRTESELRGQIETLKTRAGELQSREAVLNETLERTKADLAVALRPEVSTSLPTAKDAAPRR
jgi:hypothetical protein